MSHSNFKPEISRRGVILEHTSSGFCFRSSLYLAILAYFRFLAYLYCTCALPRRGISVKSFAHNMVSGFCWLPDFCYRSLKNNYQFYCVCAVLFLILYDSTGVLHDFTMLYHLFFVWSGLVWCMGQVPDWEGLFEVLDSDGSGTLAWDELREGRWPSFSVLWIERPNSFLRFPFFAKLNLEFLLWKTLTNCNRVCLTSLNPFHFGVLGFLSIFLTGSH